MRRPALPGLHPAVPGVGPGHADDAQRRAQARLAQEEAPQAARHRHGRRSVGGILVKSDLNLRSELNLRSK